MPIASITVIEHLDEVTFEEDTKLGVSVFLDGGRFPELPSRSLREATEAQSTGSRSMVPF